jgi:DNA-binding protein H-NS
MPKQKMNLAHLNVPDLVTMRDEVHRVLAKKIDDERTQLQARLTALEGFALGRRSGGAGRSRVAMGLRAPVARKVHALKGRKVPIKYRGPKGETWTGRGLAPRWLAALEAKGKRRERFLV